MTQRYKIMSFNVRIQTPHDGEQQFDNRVDYICDYLRAEQPDVCGLQELSHTMRKKLIDRLPGYGILGGGRNSDHRGEAAAILYREERLMPERLETEMLSYTPHVLGTTFGGDQSSCPRVYSSVDFMPFDDGEPFRFMNTHFDHVGVNARKLEIAEILTGYERQQVLRPMPTILTGDFNMEPDSEEMALFLDHGAFTDITKDIGGTYHGYGRLEKPVRIDYIFTAGQIETAGVRTFHEKRGGLYISDHDPVIAEVLI